jgi:kynureninase
MDELLKYRSRFPILANTTYMISHSLGAMPQTVYERLHKYADVWATRGIRAWAEGWWGMPVTTGNKIAPLIGAAPGEVVMHQNVSVSVSLLLSALEFRPPRNRILYVDVEFPTVIYVLEAQRRKGADVIAIPSRDGLEVPVDALIDAIDERTLIVPLSYVFFKNSARVDVERVVRKAHQMGAYVLVDAYQATGVVPVDVKAWGVDFLVGGSVKWLCGGPGAGYLYVNPSLYAKLEPSVTGWVAHEHPFAFETGAIKYAQDATRFLHGSPQIPVLYAAEPGYEILGEIGVPAIRKKSIRQTSRIFELCDAQGWTTHTPRDPEARGGTVVVDIPHGDAVVKELAARNVLVDYRPGAGIRISPHFYSTDNDIDATFDAIKDILKTGAHERHLQQRGSQY